MSTVPETLYAAAEVLRYAEVLERQQKQLVAGLQGTYSRLLKANLWPGAALPETDGRPFTHDILARLDLLEIEPEGSGEAELFEDGSQKLQEGLLPEAAPRMISEHPPSPGLRRSTIRDIAELPQAPLPLRDNTVCYDASRILRTQSAMPPSPRVQFVSPSSLYTIDAPATAEDDCMNFLWNDRGSYLTDPLLPQPATPLLSMCSGAYNSYTQSAVYDVPLPYDGAGITQGPCFEEALPRSTSSTQYGWSTEYTEFLGVMDKELSKFFKVRA
ncbi:Fluconazole resistance protein 1 [Taxawa tesnikishii (nom. ined.)]|nr:Fluconazole resistance protein 1 [Dothideales sp. JES 119]